MTERAALKVLRLPLKAEFFDAIKAGTKTEEFRLVTPYWTKRIERQEPDLIELTRGYPKAGDLECHLTRPWRGCAIRIITHPHFGPKPVAVYAIKVN